MIFFYIDGAGGPELHHEPLLNGETPLFCLSAVALHSSQWRELDRDMLKLKRTYFSRDMERYAVRYGYRQHRAEHFEVKGADLFSPSKTKIRRNRKFAEKIFSLSNNLNVRMFSVIWKKNPNKPTDPISIYTQSIQILAERFQKYCEQVDDTGIMVVDATSQTLDFRVGASYLSYIFGHTTGRQVTSLIEAPVFVDSKLSAGIQLADILGGAIYGCYYHHKCSNVPGLFDGKNPVNPKEFASDPEGPWQSHIPARDYSHCEEYWSYLRSMEFKRKDTPPSTPGSPVPAYYGFRFIEIT